MALYKYSSFPFSFYCVVYNHCTQRYAHMYEQSFLQMTVCLGLHSAEGCV